MDSFFDHTEDQQVCHNYSSKKDNLKYRMWMEAGIFVQCSWQKCTTIAPFPPTTTYCLNSAISLWLIVLQSSHTWWELASCYSLCHCYNSYHVQNKLNLTFFLLPPPIAETQWFKKHSLFCCLFTWIWYDIWHPFLTYGKQPGWVSFCFLL